MTETCIAMMLSLLATIHGEPADALDYADLAIRVLLRFRQLLRCRNALAVLAPPVRPARTPRSWPPLSAGLRATPMRWDVPEINAAIAHLRDVLGDQTYESLARRAKR